jgi:adenylate kinase
MKIYTKQKESILELREDFSKDSKKPMRDIILIGAPGAGKGTQAKSIVRKLGYVHVSTGDLVRDEISKGTSLGIKLQDIVKCGDLVSNEDILALMHERVNTQKLIVLDGYPRTLEQAKLMTGKMLRFVSSLVVYLQLDVENVVDRISNRIICQSCHMVYNYNTKPKNNDPCSACGSYNLKKREDDSEGTVRKRFEIFMRESDELLRYFQAISGVKVVIIDATQSEASIFNEICEVLNS